MPASNPKTHVSWSGWCLVLVHQSGWVLGHLLHQAVSSLHADPKPRQQHLAQGLVLCPLPGFVVTLVAVSSSGAVLLVLLLSGQQLSTGQAGGMSLASLH